MLSEKQREQWQQFVIRLRYQQYLAGPTRALVLVIADHLQALEAEHAAAVALRANNEAHLACDNMTELATIAECNGPLYKAWCAAIEAVEKGGEAASGT